MKFKQKFNTTKFVQLILILTLSCSNYLVGQRSITRSLPGLSYTELLPKCGLLYDGVSFTVDIAQQLNPALARNDGNPPLYLIMFYSTEKFNKLRNRGESQSEALIYSRYGIYPGHSSSDPFILDISFDKNDNIIFKIQNANNMSVIYATYTVEKKDGIMKVKERLENGTTNKYSISEDLDREDLLVLKLFASIDRKNWIKQEYGESKLNLINCLKKMYLIN